VGRAKRVGVRRGGGGESEGAEMGERDRAVEMEEGDRSVRVFLLALRESGSGKRGKRMRMRAGGRRSSLEARGYRSLHWIYKRYEEEAKGERGERAVGWGSSR
jgi:hypothetical protein